MPNDTKTHLNHPAYCSIYDDGRCTCGHTSRTVEPERSPLAVGAGTWAVLAEKAIESRDAALERAALLEKQRDSLVALLAKVFEWEDASYAHAVMHIENAVLNLRAELATAKAFHDVAVSQRDGANFLVGQLEAEVSQLRDEALRYRLDKFAIDTRAEEAVELVERRAEVLELKAKIAELRELLANPEGAYVKAARAKVALENVRSFTLLNRPKPMTPEFFETILRYCAEGGAVPRILR